MARFVGSESLDAFVPNDLAHRIDAPAGAPGKQRTDGQFWASRAAPRPLGATA